MTRTELEDELVELRTQVAELKALRMQLRRNEKSLLRRAEAAEWESLQRGAKIEQLQQEFSASLDYAKENREAADEYRRVAEGQKYTIKRLEGVVRELA